MNQHKALDVAQTKSPNCKRLFPNHMSKEPSHNLNSVFKKDWTDECRNKNDVVRKYLGLWPLKSALSGRKFPKSGTKRSCWTVRRVRQQGAPKL